MFQRQPQGGRDSATEQLLQSAHQQRLQTEELARQLSEQSGQSWLKAIEGLVALPTAIAVSAAATTLYLLSFIGRGFEIFELSLANVNQQPLEAQGQRQVEPQRQGREGRIETGPTPPNTPRA